MKWKEIDELKYKEKNLFLSSFNLIRQYICKCTFRNKTDMEPVYALSSSVLLTVGTCIL